MDSSSSAGSSGSSKQEQVDLLKLAGEVQGPSSADQLTTWKSRKQFVDEKLEQNEELLEIIVEQLMDKTLYRALKAKKK